MGMSNCLKHHQRLKNDVGENVTVHKKSKEEWLGENDDV